MLIQTNFPDALVRFAEDGPNGAQFVRYNNCLFTWKEFVEIVQKELYYPWDQAQIFATEYVQLLKKEII